MKTHRRTYSITPPQICVTVVKNSGFKCVFSLKSSHSHFLLLPRVWCCVSLAVQIRCAWLWPGCCFFKCFSGPLCKHNKFIHVWSFNRAPSISRTITINIAFQILQAHVEGGVDIHNLTMIHWIDNDDRNTDRQSESMKIQMCLCSVQEAGWVKWKASLPSYMVLKNTQWKLRFNWFHILTIYLYDYLHLIFMNSN